MKATRNQREQDKFVEVAGNTAVRVKDVSAEGSGATTQTSYNITLTVADTEYSQALPANTKKIEFRNRNSNDLRWSFTTGKVATPTAPYSTLKTGFVHWDDDLDLESKTLYFASSSAGDVVELEVWQ